jgi:hypothetical protein
MFIENLSGWFDGTGKLKGFDLKHLFVWWAPQNLRSVQTLTVFSMAQPLVIAERMIVANAFAMLATLVRSAAPL